MDVISWFITNLHQLLGHDKTAVIIGALSGDKRACLICQYEADPSNEKRQMVIDAIGKGAS